MEILLLGNPGNLRNPSLEALVQSGQARSVPPVFLEEREWSTLVPQDQNLILLGRKLTLGEAGCYLAHQRAWTGIEGEWALILEDDAEISQEAIDEIAQFANDHFFQIGRAHV